MPTIQEAYRVYRVHFLGWGSQNVVRHTAKIDLVRGTQFCFEVEPLSELRKRVKEADEVALDEKDMLIRFVIEFIERHNM